MEKLYNVQERTHKKFANSFTNDRFLFTDRTRRRQAREQSGKRAEHKEGLSSDDEQTSTDITSFNLEKGDPSSTLYIHLI